MDSLHYFDDPEEGLSRATTHPRFVELAREDFYYDCADDFSPFGSDDGNDTLASLEDWYREGGQDHQISDFLSELVNDWDFGLPAGLIRADSETIETWLGEDKMHETYLVSECRARVAVAFGQLKITGHVESEIVDEGLAAIRCQLWFNGRARIHYPNWKFADEDHERLIKMQTVLNQL